jgi:hypothetical protein
MTSLTYFKGIPPKRPRTAIANKRDCRDCRYYSNGKCTLFISLDNNYKLVHPSSEIIRLNEEQCGCDAKLFKEKINIILK